MATEAAQATPSRRGKNNNNVERIIQQRPSTNRINYQATPDKRPKTPVFTPSLPGHRSNAARVAPGSLRAQKAAVEPNNNNNVDRNNKQRAAVTLKRPHEELEQLTKGGSVGKESKRQRTDNHSTANKKLSRKEREKKAIAELVDWKEKYLGAFPKFKFYFDHIDEATAARLKKYAKQLGSTVSQFFSRDVTHIVTTREFAVETSNKENVPRLATPFKESGAKSSARQATMLPPNLDSHDVLVKAVELKMRIWSLNKLNSIFDRLIERSPSRTLFRPLSLPTLLQTEQIYGTTERDPFAPHPDMYYFSSKSFFLLVEDSTGEHKPICIKEFPGPKKGSDPAWPVLYGGVEGRTAFYHYTGTKIHHQRRDQNRILLAKPPPAKAAPVVAARAVAPDLRRSLSLNAIKAKGAAEPRKGEFLAASGNSQIITSNIASTTSAALSGAARPNGKTFTDKRIQALSKHMVESRFGQPQVGKLKRSESVDAGLSRRAAIIQDEPKKPGYCENCRLRYEDFREHIVTRRHRKFACNDDNWLDLDDLLSRIERPRAYVEFSEDEDDGDEEEEEEEDDDEESEESSMSEELGDDSGWAEYVDSDKQGGDGDETQDDDVMEDDELDQSHS